MSADNEELVNVPAIFYSLFWQTREMGFFKDILEKAKIEHQSTLILFTDFKPGALISFDQEKGDFKIQSIDSIEDIDYDCAIIGKLRPIIKSFEKHFLLKNFWNLISGKIKIKGLGKILKFAKVLMRCAI